MRMSCNGCRVLRKGCSDGCTIRPCLEWIRSPEAQANATVFLAKFYGRAGLVNLINAGPPNLRPAIFRSLLYEACGRIVNPIQGSLGLLCAGSWNRCQEAVEAVLAGSPIAEMDSDAAETQNGPPLKACDIRHVCNKDAQQSGSSSAKQVRSRRRFKRSGAAPGKRGRVCLGTSEESIQDEADRSPSHVSSLSHQSAAAEISKQSRDTARPDPDDGEIELNLRLGLEPAKRRVIAKSPAINEVDSSVAEDSGDLCKMELRLHFPAA